MSTTLALIRDLVKGEQVSISAHDYDELAAENILVKAVTAGLGEARIVEDYPEYSKGPCVLVLQRDGEGNPIHVVWGIPKGARSPAVLVTAYRPDPERWTDDFTRRRP